MQRLLAVAVIAAAAQASAIAQVSFNILIGPPAPLFEQVPVMSPGYVWAPGYWAWHGDRHIWIHGSTMVQRIGYRWEPDVWEQRNTGYYRHPGRWERDSGYRAQPRAQVIRSEPQRNNGPGKSKERGNSGKHRKDNQRGGH
jgi:hypothetical protein